MNDISSINAASYAAAIDYLERRAPAKADIKRYSYAGFNAVWGTYLNGRMQEEFSGACHGSCKFVGVDTVATQNRGLHDGFAYRDASMSLAAKRFEGKNIDRAVLERWTDWLFNRSWAAPYIHAPSLNFAVDYGFAFGTEIPSNWALAICTLSRHSGEHAHIVTRWFDLLEKYQYLTEDAAYAIAFGIATSDNPYAGNTSGYNGFLSGHTTVMFGQNLDYLRNVAQQRIVKSNAPAIDGGDRQGVQAMWGPVGRDTSLYASIKAMEPKIETSSVVIPNPFAPVARGSLTVNEKLLHAVMPQLFESLNQPVVEIPKETKRAAQR